MEDEMLETRVKTTRTVICCLADRELSEWSARCFIAAGLNSLACCTLRDLDRYAAAVQADAVVLDAAFLADADAASVLARCHADDVITGMVRDEADATESVHGVVRPDVWFPKPLNCDAMALQLNTVLKRARVPADVRGAEPASGDDCVRLDTRWCQLHVHRDAERSVTMDLSANEYRLLHALLSVGGRVWSREELLAVLAKGGSDLQVPRSVDQSVRCMRDHHGANRWLCLGAGVGW
jgi:DNA-binding response OmpR family regulator